MSIGLAERLRRETRDLHTEVERAGVMGDLLHGRVDAATYAALLHNLHAIYATLETGLLQHAAHADVAHVVEPALFRAAALAADLAVLGGARRTRATALQPATRRYVQRLQAASATAPELLAAHAYVRYLGDLNGGQILRAIVARCLALPDGAGTAFYDFGAAALAVQRAAALRRGLDAIGSDAGKADRIVAEARCAFDLHRALFIELATGAQAPRATP